MPKELKIESGAQSMCNGVQIKSNRYEGYYSIATINENGEIVLLIVRMLILDFDIQSIIKIIIRIFTISTFILLLCIIMLGGDENTKRFHGAEHKVIQAFNELGRVPTLEETYNYSRLDYGCGTSFGVMFVFIFLIIFISTFSPDIWIAFDKIYIGLIIMIILYFVGVFDIFQFFTTSRPTDRELMVAISAVSNWIENESKNE